MKTCAFFFVALMFLLVSAMLLSTVQVMTTEASTGNIYINSTGSSIVGQRISAGGSVDLYFGSVTWSGAQFYLMLSADGFSQVSAGDTRYSALFDVTNLVATAPSTYTYKSMSWVVGNGWVKGYIPLDAASGNYWIKAFDGATNNVAVTDTYISVTALTQDSVKINGGAVSSKSSKVTLTLTQATRLVAFVDVVAMSFTNVHPVNNMWSEWEPDATTKQWTLMSGTGTRTVYARYRIHLKLSDTYSVSDWFSDSIEVVTTAPTGTVAIKNGAQYTTSRDVMLTLSASDDSSVKQMRFNNEGGAWSDWQTYATSKSWTLTTGDGTKTVYAQFMDDAGLKSSETATKDTILLDTVNPTGSIAINGGEASTSSALVTLTLTSADATSGVDKVRYTNNDAWGSEPWETPSATKSWTLDAVHDEQQVSYQIRDKAGLISQTYYDTINFVPEKVATPTITPVGGTYYSTQSVTISCATSDATIRYTTNGADPTSSSILYSGAISVSSSGTVKARAFKSGLADSDVASATYTINIPSKVATPAFNPAGGSYSSAQSVALSCATSGATIRYTTDGSTPSSSSTAYSGAIWVSSTTTIKAKAFKSGMIDSGTAAATYTIVPSFEVRHHQVTHEDKVFDVQTRSNSSVSSLTFNQAQKRIRFNVDGATGTSGLCEITIPAELLSGDFTVYIDDASVFFTKTSNATHNTLSLNYGQSNHWIEVFGTEVIPEFEAWLFLPFVIAATLLAFALRKRNKKQ